LIKSYAIQPSMKQPIMKRSCFMVSFSMLTMLDHKANEEDRSEYDASNKTDDVVLYYSSKISAKHINSPL